MMDGQVKCDFVKKAIIEFSFGNLKHFLMRKWVCGG